MLTDTARGPTDARSFVAWGVAWSIGLFGLLRLPWTEMHVLLPFTQAQGGIAVLLFGTPALPVQVTLACSGVDALALCLAAVIAYPVSWRARLSGAAGGAALILTLNTLRIGTLGRAAGSAAWFDTLHLYVWPALLTLAIAGYVFTWMHLVDCPIRAGGRTPEPRDPAALDRPQLSRHFILLAIVFILVFSIASPLYLENTGVLALAGGVARTAAAILGLAGITAYASANLLVTPRGAFAVTQECITTPLIPIYLAAVCAYAGTRRRVLIGILAAIPIFLILGVIRLLVVALPDAIGSPLFLVHAFYQLLLGIVVVILAAFWRHPRRAAPAHAGAGIIGGALLMLLLAPFCTPLLASAGLIPADDPQGAIGLLPAFQLGLYLALWIAAFVRVGWTRILAGLVLLGLTQAAGLLALQALASHTALTTQVRDIRGWAIAAPVLIFVMVIRVARPPR